MSILAICARMYPEIRIYAFQIMSNHIHLVVGGDERRIWDFFSFFVSRLEKYFKGEMDLGGFVLKLFPVEDLNYFRNAVSYVNRNGFVVNDDVTPFSYPWGTSAYFFQPFAKKYVKACGNPMGVIRVRELMHTRTADSLKDILMTDGYVSPAEFCHTSLAEQTFRSAKQYFYLISRNIETYADIARTIGESIFYNDNDLYLAAMRLAKEHFGTNDLQTIPAAGKLELAKWLHFDYNAGEKQLQRILKIDANIVKAIF